MTLEQMERRLRALEQSTRGFDYVRACDDKDALEDAENASKSKEKNAHKDDTD